MSRKGCTRCLEGGQSRLLRVKDPREQLATVQKEGPDRTVEQRIHTRKRVMLIAQAPGIKTLQHPTED